MKGANFTADQVRNLMRALIKGRFRTQAALANAMGVSPPFVNDILRGKREPAGKVLGFLGLERIVSYRGVAKIDGHE